MDNIRYILVIDATLNGEKVSGSIPKDWDQADDFTLQNEDINDTRLLRSRLDCEELFKGLQSIEDNSYELNSWFAFRVKVMDDGKVLPNPESIGGFYAPHIPNI